MGNIIVGSPASSTVVAVGDLGPERRYKVKTEVEVRGTNAGSPLGTKGVVVGLHPGGAFVRYTEGRGKGREELCWDDEIVVASAAARPGDM
jgi:hypothetical protein